MKPDSSPPGSPFNFDAIPLWIKPDLWDERKKVRCRGLLFVLLYVLSVAVFAAIIFVPIGFYKGVSAMGTTALIWLSCSLFFGVPVGLAVWWDFVRASPKIPAEAAKTSQDESPSDSPVDRKPPL